MKSSKLILISVCSVIAVIVAVFYYFDNKWLEDN